MILPRPTFDHRCAEYLTELKDRPDVDVHGRIEVAQREIDCIVAHLGSGVVDENVDRLLGQHGLGHFADRRL